MHPLLAQYQQTLTGRLKAKLLTKLSGSDDVIPSDRAIWSFLMQRWKENATEAEFMFHLLHCGGVREVEVPPRFSQQALTELTIYAWSYGQIRRHFVEGRVHGCPGNPRLACILLGHVTPENHLGYYAVVLDEKVFPEAWAGFVSIVIGEEFTSTRIETLRGVGWEPCNAPFNQAPEVRVALATLRDVVARPVPKTVNIDDIKLTPSALAPRDDEFMRRVKLVYRERMPATIAVTDVATIRAYDIDFCRTINSDIIDFYVEAIESRRWPTLVVYWAEDKFVMSDDYCTYLAYRRLRYVETRVAIMGPFPEDAARVVRRGGSELMPPLMLTPVAKEEEQSEEFREWALDEQLNGDAKANLPVDHLACWTGFANCLARGISEAHVHRFILKHPIVLNAYGTEVKSEVWLGKRYRIDLVVRQPGLVDTVQLVELEHPRETVFTKAGRPKRKVTHGKQQVEDWLRWWREHPEQRPQDLAGAIEPRGLVVIGRSRDMTNEERRVLAHLNEGSDVIVITYDELLDQFGTLLLGRLKEKT